MNRVLRVLTLFAAATLLRTIGPAQEQEEKIDHQTNFTAAEMNKMWQEFSQDKAWMVIMKEVKEKGFERRRDEKSAWGFKGVRVAPKGPRSEVLLCVFDIQRKGSKQTGTLVWAQEGNERYKAYVLLPEEGKGAEHAEEWFVDKDLKIQRAHSWFSCLNAKLAQVCGRVCMKSLAPCGVIGVSTEIFYPGVGVAALLGCIAVICGGCAAVVSISCAFAR